MVVPIVEGTARNPVGSR